MQPIEHHDPIYVSQFNVCTVNAIARVPAGASLAPTTPLNQINVEVG